MSGHRETVIVPDRVWEAVDRAILSTASKGRIVSLVSILDDLGTDRWDYKTKRVVSRAMRLRGAESFTRSRNGWGGSYLVPDAVREAVVAGEVRV